MLSNPAGEAVDNSNYTYTPFGDLATDSDGTAAATSYRFTGQYADADLGLQYHRARWLNTSRAGWISQDPVWDFPGNFGNGYGYAGLNPVNSIDVNGKMSLAAVSVAAGISVLLAVAVGQVLKRTWTEEVIGPTEASSIIERLQTVEHSSIRSLTPINFNASGKIFIFEGDNSGGWPVSVATYSEWGIEKAKEELSVLYPNANIEVVRTGTSDQLLSVLNNRNAIGVVFLGHGGGWRSWSHGFLACADTGLYADDDRLVSNLQFFIAIACSSGTRVNGTEQNWQEATNASFFFGYKHPVVATVLTTQIRRSIQLLKEAGAK